MAGAVGENLMVEGHKGDNAARGRDGAGGLYETGGTIGRTGAGGGRDMLGL